MLSSQKCNITNHGFAQMYTWNLRLIAIIVKVCQDGRFDIIMIMWK